MARLWHGYEAAKFQLVHSSSLSWFIALKLIAELSQHTAGSPGQGDATMSNGESQPRLV